MAPATSAVRSSTSRSARASTSMPSIPSVPLIRARPSLARSTSGRDAGLGHGGGAVDERAVGAAGLALAEQHQRGRRQRGEVAAGAERAVLAHDRRDAGVEQGEHRVDDDRPGAREAHRQAAGAQQDHRPDDLALDLRAHARRRASGPAPSAARPSARPGSPCWPGRRTRSTPRTPAPGCRPAGRRRPRRARAAARASSPSVTAPTVPGDGDDVGGRHAVRPRARAGRGRPSRRT